MQFMMGDIEPVTRQSAKKFQYSNLMESFVMKRTRSPTDEWQRGMPANNFKGKRIKKAQLEHQRRLIIHQW